ncbi:MULTISPECIES: acyl-CoA thioesterase [Salinibaculum]|uniref:acyl-CoA thioesterase n=1 Tax=Salinibaculum TaxID=2732368 RepID=UPI0030CDD337
MPTLLETKVETRRYIFPGQSNAMGTAHGGDLLKWMEQVAAMAAMRFAGSETVTVGMDDIAFRRPIPQGSIALLDAYVIEAGSSSVTVHVRCYDEDRYTGERDLAVKAISVLAAVDEDGETVSVPDLTVKTEVGERLRAEARDAT